MLREQYYLSLAALILLASPACVRQTSSASVQVAVSGLSSGAQPGGKTYVLLSGNENVAETDLQFREFAALVHRVLQHNGLRPATPGMRPDQLIFLSYGMGAPQTHYLSRPIVGVIGGGNYGVNLRNSDGTTSSGTVSAPIRYGVVGSRTQSYRTYRRYLLLASVDFPASLEAEKVIETWRTTVVSRGLSDDLRRVFPYLAAATRNYIARNSQRIDLAIGMRGRVLPWLYNKQTIAATKVPQPQSVEDILASEKIENGSGPPGSRSPEVQRGGTCFVISPTGAILTNGHVVGSHRRVRVFLAAAEKGQRARVELLFPEQDLAVLRLEEESGELDYLSLASSQDVAIGDRVFTLGYPAIDSLGVEPKFTEGSISAKNGLDSKDWMQISVPVQPGNSGGPLVLDSGVVVGVVTARIRDDAFYEKYGSVPQNINFAVKVDRVLESLFHLEASPLALDRKDAINRVKKALCYVVTDATRDKRKRSAP